MRRRRAKSLGGQAHGGLMDIHSIDKRKSRICGREQEAKFARANLLEEATQGVAEFPQGMDWVLQNPLGCTVAISVLGLLLYVALLYIMIPISERRGICGQDLQRYHSVHMLSTSVVTAVACMDIAATSLAYFSRHGKHVQAFMGAAITLMVGVVTISAYVLLLAGYDCVVLNSWGRETSLIRWCYYVSTGVMLSLSMSILGLESGEVKGPTLLATSLPLSLMIGVVAVTTPHPAVAKPCLIAAVCSFSPLLSIMSDSVKACIKLHKAETKAKSKAESKTEESKHDDEAWMNREQRQLLAQYHLMIIGVGSCWTALVVLWMAGIAKLISREHEEISHCLFDMTSKGVQALMLSNAHAVQGMRRLALEKVACAAEASAAQRAFLRYVFHEVRVPLNSISLALQTISMKLRAGLLPEDVAVEEALDGASSGVLTMTRVLDEVLNWEQMCSGQLQMRLEPTFLSDILVGATKFFKDAALNSNMSLRVIVPPEVEGLVLECDSFKVSQVLHNLLSNAIKFSEMHSTVNLRMAKHPGSGKKADEGQVMFEVEDEGVGITEEDMNRLFVPFSQVRPGDLQHSRGSGLGLCIAKGIVEYHGGSIWCESEIGKGSRFFFTIGLSDDVPVVTETQTLLGKDPVDESLGGDLTPLTSVLVVDDVTSTRKLMARALHHLGIEPHQIYQAADGMAALREYDTYPHIQLILMDGTMPVMDGITATKELKTRGCNAIILGVTGLALSSDTQDFLAAGANRVLTKPLSLKLLHSLIKEHGFSCKEPVMVAT
ncbi:unnamed protein product [Chrysoparadoxa australica]